MPGLAKLRSAREEMDEAMDILANVVPVGVFKTHNIEYRKYKDRFLKRSLGRDEICYDKKSGKLLTSPRTTILLENDAAALRFVARNTEIPVPTVLAAFDKGGIYYLWMEMIPGVTMNTLQKWEKAVVMEELEKHVATLNTVPSFYVGGPSGVTCLPNWLVSELPHGMRLPYIYSNTQDYVFCHMDLGQTNVIVDPMSLKINGIVGWEFAGFYPSYFEGHFFRNSLHSGLQYRALMDVPKMVGFFFTARNQIIVDIPEAEEVVEDDVNQESLEYVDAEEGVGAAEAHP